MPSPTALDGFRCGEREIDGRLHECNKREAEHTGRTFVGIIDAITLPVGFYTLSIQAQDSQHLDADISKGRYGHIPFIYLNFLAVQDGYQRQGVGTILLGHALDKCELVARNVGSFGVALHALTRTAADLYYKYGFRPVEGSRPDRPFMVLPIKTLLDLAAIKRGER